VAHAPVADIPPDAQPHSEEGEATDRKHGKANTTATGGTRFPFPRGLSWNPAARSR
jgi:hypothetical protein